MDHGSVVADDTPDRLKARIAGDVVALGLPDAATHEKAEVVVRSAVPVRDVVVAEAGLHVTVDDGAVTVAPLLRALDAAGFSPSSVSVSRPTLDDVFLTLTGRSLREGEEVA
jgi:ABC-2 type transport system ATP-binding protein